MAIESINPGASASLFQQQGSAQQADNDVLPVQQADNARPIESGKPTESIPAFEEQQAQFVEKLEATVEKLNDLMKDGQRSLSFSVDKELDEIVIKVVDTETEEVIRQIPNEESLKFAKDLEGVIGVIYNDRA